MRFSRAWPDFSWGDVVNVHDAHNVVFSIAASLQIGIQLIPQSVVHAVSEEGRVNADFSLEVTEEEHFGGFLGATLDCPVRSESVRSLFCDATAALLGKRAFCFLWHLSSFSSDSLALVAVVLLCADDGEPVRAVSTHRHLEHGTG